MQTKGFKSGFIAVMGRPNVGKSTLVNTLVGQKIAAVTPRPQTTRKRQMGILSTETAQAIFVDTPGVHRPRHKLGEYMNKEALETLTECDIILVVVDISQEPDIEDQLLAEVLRKAKTRAPVLLALNKADIADEHNKNENKESFAGLFPLAAQFVLSALQNLGVDLLLESILENLPEGEPFFPVDQVTDLYERELSADLVREAALIHLRDEVPHGIAVRIDQFTERSTSGAYIEATILVEKESHKPIVIGQNGEMLKRIGVAARQEIEATTGRKIFLQLRVKVRKNWRDDENVIKRLY
jgi:GTPase